jgi:gliding motility associated protien GldN
MKRLLFVLLITCFAGSALAQPAARRKAIQESKKKATVQLSDRAKLQFPTTAPMPEDVVWRRDIYRTLDLTQNANAGLYYPVEPVGKEMNLFTYIFKLVLTGNLTAYEYRLDGNESFTDSDKIKLKDMLNSYHIFFEEKDGRIKVDNSDIPSSEVLSYYIKECSYYDQGSSTFHTKVIALCPVMHRSDDFGGEATKYPLFWIKYDDLAPFLSKQTIMTSNLNNAATMSADDYFTMNMYKGKIYKTNNMLGKTLAQYCTTDSAMNAEQKRIEGELQEFEKHVWGDQAKKDSLDSIAKLQNPKGKKVKKTKTNRRSSDDEVEVKTKKSKSSSSSSSSSPARVSVRRQRH